MIKPNIPAHLVVVLMLLGLLAMASPVLTIFPVVLLAWLGSTALVLLIPAVMLSLFAWFAWLLAGLLLRQTWAPRAARITAGVLCLVGSLGVMWAFASGDVLVWLVWGGGAGLLVATGGYVLWALGRGDVREWLTESAPAT